MKILLCHPQTQHSKKVAKILYEENLLYKFVNPVSISNEVANRLPEFIKRKPNSRIIFLPSHFLATNYTLEYYKLYMQKLFRKEKQSAYMTFREKYQQSIGKT